MAKIAHISQDRPIFIGHDNDILIDVVDEDTDLPLDMTGFTLEWVLRKDLNGTAEITKTAPDITIEDGQGTNDRARIKLYPDDFVVDTVMLAPGAYNHELRRIDLGNVVPYAYGYAHLELVAGH